MFNPDFDQGFVTHLLSEHRRIHRMLVLARRNLADEDSAWPAKFEQVLGNVRAELQAHFAEEEQGGCLDQAVSLHPVLSPKLRHIEEEHPQLLAALDRLRAQARDAGDTVRDRVKLKFEFDNLCRDLHAHEAAENDILRRGFGVEIEPEETDPNGLAGHAADA